MKADRAALGMGRRQWAVLIQMKEKGGWWPGCGWQALPGSAAHVGYAVLATLRERGLVESPLGNYRLTPLGKKIMQVNEGETHGD